ncbi:hypothetical protein PPACK8108_LOCUS502 [Phakopsora pachyrhizi]|uniref:Secreted protein n=1 Tax=Phakopsora pachyrhizi TaxID=170000 RepID=A0AAV0ADQ1_PHAPC|nr:hypothetical protein PPACK8108_LOCUS502 [Phakopsora pachyrhizi]
MFCPVSFRTLLSASFPVSSMLGINILTEGHPSSSRTNLHSPVLVPCSRRFLQDTPRSELPHDSKLYRPDATKQSIPESHQPYQKGWVVVERCHF